MQIDMTDEERDILIRWKKRSDTYRLVRMKAEAIVYVPVVSAWILSRRWSSGRGRRSWRRFLVNRRRRQVSRPASGTSRPLRTSRLIKFGVEYKSDSF